MRNTSIVLALFLVNGCAAPQRVDSTGGFISEDRHPESKPLPPNPREEKLEGEFAEPEWVESLEKGEVAAKAGILISESRAARDILFRTRYDELRRYYEADRMVWGAHRLYYEERLHRADQEISRLQPTWWDNHATSIAVVGGIIVGFSLTLGVTKIVYEAR